MLAMWGYLIHVLHIFMYLKCIFVNSIKNDNCDLHICEQVENGFKGNCFPVIIADASICKELRPLESEFDEEEKICDAISEEHEYHFGRPKSRDEALHFLNELGWLFQRERLSSVHEVPEYTLDRFKFVLTFSVERNCCMIVKTLLDMLVDKHLEGERLSTGSMEMLKTIQLLNRAVKRKYISMVDLLVHYSIPSKNDTSKKYVFPPNLEGPGGITPLHLAASTLDSEGVIDSLTNDPQEVIISFPFGFSDFYFCRE